MEPTISKFGNRDGLVNFSDYGRPMARWAAFNLKNTRVSVMNVTTFHLAIGMWAAYHILLENFIFAAILIVIKGIIDAIDGELARVRNRPSYVGRYYDSIADFITTSSFFLALGLVLKWSWYSTLAVLVFSMLQVTLSNYYGVLIRESFNGDKHSRIDESRCPEPYPWDHLLTLKILHWAYKVVYDWQDRLIVYMHPRAMSGKTVSTAAYNLSSLLGFGAQAIIFLGLTVLGKTHLVFVYYTIVNGSLFLALILGSHLHKSIRI